MDRHRKHLEQQLAEAEREIDAATKPSEIRKAAAKLQRARAELGWLEEKKTGRPSRGPGSDRESQG